MQRNGALYVIITLLGLYGGLTVAFRFCIPLIIGWWRKRKITAQIEQNAAVSRMERLRALWQWIRAQMVDLNLFKTAATSTDPFQLRTAIISTRIYLLLMLVSITIIVIYTLLPVRIQTATIQNPSLMTFERLYNAYESTIQCLCSRIVIPYRSFTSLSPKLHPVCSSLFISDTWIISTSGSNMDNLFFRPQDFRLAARTFFNTLAIMCSLAQTTITDSWYVYKQSSLITDLALSKSELNTRTEMALEKFETKTITEFQRDLALIETHTKTMYATGYEVIWLHTDQLSSTHTPIDFGWIPVQLPECLCGLEEKCHRVMGFYNYTEGAVYISYQQSVNAPYHLLYSVPNVIVGCFVISSFYESSLECFFNQTCLDVVQAEIKSPQSINISILETNSTGYSPKTNIGTIVDNIMIETWNENIQYDQYYEQCAPERCTYTFTSRNHVLQVVTTLVGLFGGLSIALKLISIHGVSWIRNYIRSKAEKNNVANRPSLIIRLRAAWHLLKTKVSELNLFESELSWNDDEKRRTEIITTRLYLLLLSITVAILIFYTTISVQSRIVEVQSPSQAKFDELRQNPQYSSTLDCPCQNITIAYNSFISISPHYHQLCSSDFVVKSSDWISLIYGSSVGFEYPYDDFRVFVVPQFQLLASLCTLANETLNVAVDSFVTSTMISERARYRETIEAKADNILNQFRLSTSRAFVRTLNFIRSMAQGNGIVSSILSNWHFLSSNKTEEFNSLWPEPRSYGNENCSCGTSAMCTAQAAFNGSVVPGFRVGCYPLEALLQSTLECLYNVSCIDMLGSMYNHSNFTINPLDSTLSSLNATVQSLVDVLFVDRWETNMSYDRYYEVCAPRVCTYIVNERVDLAYIVASIIAFYGGLVVALKLVTPIIVKIGKYLIRCHRQRVQPAVVMGEVSN